MGELTVQLFTALAPTTTMPGLSKILRYAGKNSLGSVKMTINSERSVVSYDNYYPSAGPRSRGLDEKNKYKVGPEIIERGQTVTPNN